MKKIRKEGKDEGRKEKEFFWHLSFSHRCQRDGAYLLK